MRPQLNSGTLGGRAAYSAEEMAYDILLDDDAETHLFGISLAEHRALFRYVTADMPVIRRFSDYWHDAFVLRDEVPRLLDEIAALQQRVPPQCTALLEKFLRGLAVAAQTNSGVRGVAD
jgi:hypothetical protein